MSGWKMSEDEFERQYRAGVVAEKAACEVEPRAEDARFEEETNELTIRFSKGYRLVLPVRLVPELDKLSSAELSRVAVIGDGEGLEWPGADVHISVPGLLWRLVGSPEVARQAVAEQARRAASVTSPARAEASRANGKKGGRPRKAIAESTAGTESRVRAPKGSG